jgi:hypothetical protein
MWPPHMHACVLTQLACFACEADWLRAPVRQAVVRTRLCKRPSLSPQRITKSVVVSNGRSGSREDLHVVRFGRRLSSLSAPHLRDMGAAVGESQERCGPDNTALGRRRWPMLCDIPRTMFAWPDPVPLHTAKKIPRKPVSQSVNVAAFRLRSEFRFSFGRGMITGRR